MPTFKGFMRIDTLQQLISFERNVLQDRDYPLSRNYLEEHYGKSGCVTYIPSKTNPFVTGIYYIGYENSFDRFGDITMRVILMIPSVIDHISKTQKTIKSLLKKHDKSANKIQILKDAFYNKLSPEEIANIEKEKQISSKDFDIVNSTQNELEELGFSFF